MRSLIRKTAVPTAAMLLVAVWSVSIVPAFNTAIKPPPTGGGTGQAERQVGDLQAVGIDEHLDARLPMDLMFRDEAGEPVRLGDLFDGGRPVILTLGYYRCPMLCSLVLNGLVDSLKAIEMEPGDEFDLVTVSIDPGESHTLALEKKKSYLRYYGREDAGKSWAFLTGDAEPIRALADAVGFRYEYLPDQDQFAHAAVVFVITPDGRVSRYLYGVQYEPKTVRLGLVEASEGRIGTITDRFLLFCYHYDAAEGTYGPAAMKIMRLGGFVTLVALAFLVGIFWLRELRRKRTAVRGAAT
jgi:protein SCO1/2